MDFHLVFVILAAALGGAAVGIERQWSGHAAGPSARFGGVRTFTLLGGLAGLVGSLWNAGYTGPAAVLLAAAVALIVVSYSVASKHDIEATTEVAALIVLAAGLLCAADRIQLASGIIAVTCLLLLEKSRLHAWVAALNDEELRGGVRFAIMATVILPLLPEGPFGPFGGIKPRELWLLVLFFSGLSFVGYIIRRALGSGQGYALTGLLGGIVSSTNVTITFARESRDQAALSWPLAVGVMAACTVLFVRVVAATAVLNRAVSIALLPYLAAPFAVGVILTVLAVRRAIEPTATSLDDKNPLQISQALQMAGLFQLVLFTVGIARTHWGQAGVLVSGAVLGLTDLDALTFSMAKSAASGVSAHDAAQAIAVGILSNTTLKLVASAVLGAPAFRRVVGLGLFIMAMASLVTLLALN